MKKVLSGLIFILLSGCTPPLLLGHLEFDDVDKTYEFNFSKEKLKDKVVDLYSYDVGILSKNLGRTLIENPEVNKKYRRSTTEWLDRKTWDEHKVAIRQSLTDTTDIRIVKHHSPKSIRIRVIISGNENNSKLRVINISADRKRQFSKSRDYYKVKLIRKIENKFVDRLK